MTPSLVIGFDLDLTLIDSRPGILAAYRALAAETGVAIDVVAIGGRLGPKLEDELANWFPASAITETAARFRHHYRRLFAAGTTALPGAAAALDHVRQQGGSTIIVTAKQTVSAEQCLDHVGLRAEAVVGHVYGPEKAAVLRERRAAVYVGDTASDMRAAREAGAIAVGVLTGGAGDASLRAAGAQHVLADLRDFVLSAGVVLERLSP